MRNFLFLLIFIFAILSCSNGNLTILTDPWWEDSYNIDGNLNKLMLINSLTNRVSISKRTAETEEQALEILSQIYEKESVQNIIITPLFFSYIKNKLSNEKKTNIIILNGFYDVVADNIIAVYSSREEVYYKAGIKAALFSKNNDNCAVSAVFYVGSLLKQLEKECFIKGFESVLESGELLYYDQQNYTGGERLKNFINSSPEKGTGLFFFSASSANPYCLDLALPLNIPISGENLNSLGIYNELVEFSVDDDIMEIIEIAVQIGLDGEIVNDIPVKALLSEKGIHF
jgi:hypothetical protein